MYLTTVHGATDIVDPDPGATGWGAVVPAGSRGGPSGPRFGRWRACSSRVTIKILDTSKKGGTCCPGTTRYPLAMRDDVVPVAMVAGSSTP